MFSWFGGESKKEMPEPPVNAPAAVIVEPGTLRSAGEIIEEELAKMPCEPSAQLKHVVSMLKDPKYKLDVAAVMAGGRRGRGRGRKGSRASRSHRKGRRQTRKH